MQGSIVIFAWPGTANSRGRIVRSAIVRNSRGNATVCVTPMRLLDMHDSGRPTLVERRPWQVHSPVLDRYWTSVPQLNPARREILARNEKLCLSVNRLCHALSDSASNAAASMALMCAERFAKQPPTSPCLKESAQIATRYFSFIAGAPSCMPCHCGVQIDPLHTDVPSVRRAADRHPPSRIPRLPFLLEFARPVAKIDVLSKLIQRSARPPRLRRHIPGSAPRAPAKSFRSIVPLRLAGPL